MNHSILHINDINKLSAGSIHIENVHPYELKVRDCMIRAVAAVEDRPYDACMLELTEYSRNHAGRPINRTHPNIEKRGYDHVASLRYFDYHGRYRALHADAGRKNSAYTTGGFRAEGVRITTKAFAKKHPKGIFAVGVRGHMTAIIDGVIVDSWDCSKRIVTHAWEYNPAHEAPTTPEPTPAPTPAPTTPEPTPAPTPTPKAKTTRTIELELGIGLITSLIERATYTRKQIVNHIFAATETLTKNDIGTQISRGMSFKPHQFSRAKFNGRRIVRDENTGYLRFAK